MVALVLAWYVVRRTIGATYRPLAPVPTCGACYGSQFHKRAASASQGYTVANLQPDNDDATATTMELESRIAWYGWSKACLSPKRWRIFVAQAIPQILAAGMEEWQVWV